jgi:hypothetical protein
VVDGAVFAGGGEVHAEGRRVDGGVEGQAGLVGLGVVVDALALPGAGQRGEEGDWRADVSRLGLRGAGQAF